MEKYLLKNCLACRLKSYEKAIAMVTKEIPWENGYNWPDYPGRGVLDPENIYYWRGAVRELKNTLDMLA